MGDITNVTAGTNLTGGGSSGSVTVNLTASPNITSLNVGGSEVVSSSRALKNISSVDATTVAALSAAGVGGGSDWTTLSNTVTYTFTPTHPSGFTSSWIDLSTALSGLPNDFKHLLVQIKANLTGSGLPSDYYMVVSGDDSMRFGSSSSSYQQLDTDVCKGFMFLSGHPYHNAVLINSTSFYSSKPEFVYETDGLYFAKDLVQSEGGAGLASLKEPVMGSDKGPSENSGTFTAGVDINYMAIKIEAKGYSSNTGGASPIELQFKVAYVGA